MRLKTFRIRNYRSIIDTGVVEVDDEKTILVGPNEAGKSAILRALQQVSPPEGDASFDPLRDYPRRLYNDISTGKLKPSDIEVATAIFEVTADDSESLPEEWDDVQYSFTRKMDNNAVHHLIGGPEAAYYRDIKLELGRIAAAADKAAAPAADGETVQTASAKLQKIEKFDISVVKGKLASALNAWLDEVEPLINENDTITLGKFSAIRRKISIADTRDAVLEELHDSMPVFVLYNNFLRVRPIIHLERLAKRVAAQSLDDEQYDYGNLCLLKLLGFDVSKLSKLGDVSSQNPVNAEGLEEFRKPLDERRYALNAAEVRLTDGIREIWNPDSSKGEASQLRLDADGQLLTVSVVDELGVSVELDQRSEGFQWLVSFFVIFFAEAEDGHENAILLLDEPGVSLHGLKQREFQKTVDRLAKLNQTIFTTHSPFMVGSDELDKVRVVEMADRREGTKVHTTITATDAAALLPLQEALGYDLAQSLFTQSRNLVLEGLTDYWYLEATAGLLREAGLVDLNNKIALVPAASAGKVVYFATILNAQNLKVAALFDSDKAGETAANQEALVHTLGSKNILRTADFVPNGVKRSEIEDLLRFTLIEIAKDTFGIDVTSTAAAQVTRPIIDILADEIKTFSKYRLAKAFVSWSRDHEAASLRPEEKEAFRALIERINKVLR